MNNNTARATFSFTDGRTLERGRVRLSKLDGILSINVSLLTQMVSVEYDPQEITLEKIRAILKRV
jgi:heavy-metal-associated domain-containing protein